MFVDGMLHTPQLVLYDNSILMAVHCLQVMQLNCPVQSSGSQVRFILTDHVRFLLASLYKLLEVVCIRFWVV
jgi:hypothetical protein